MWYSGVDKYYRPLTSRIAKESGMPVRRKKIPQNIPQTIPAAPIAGPSPGCGAADLSQPRPLTGALDRFPAGARVRAPGRARGLHRSAGLDVGERCVVRDSNSGHQLLLPPANWCPIFASRTTQARPASRCAVQCSNMGLLHSWWPPSSWN